MYSESPTKLALISFVAATLWTLGAGILPAQVREGVAEIPTNVVLLTFDFSCDGSMCVAGGDSIRIFDTETGKLLHKLPSDKLVRITRFSPSERDLLATTDDEGVIRIWRIGEENPSRVLGTPGGWVNDLAFSPDGSLIAEGHRETPRGFGTGTFRIWNVATGDIAQSEEAEDFAFNAIGFSRDGKRVAFSKIPVDRKEPRSIEVYNHEMWQHVHSIAYAPGFARSISFSPDDRKLLLAGGESIPVSEQATRTMGRLWLASMDSDEPAKLLIPPGSHDIESAAFTPGGDEYAIGTTFIRHGPLHSNGVPSYSAVVAQVQMRNSETGEIRWSQDGEIGDPHDVTISRDGRRVGYCTGENVLILDARSGTLLHSIAVD
jgi:WD40 repeat protein